MFVLLMIWSLFFLFFMIRLPRYYDSCPSFLTSLRPVFTLTPPLFTPRMLKIECFSCLWGAQLEQKGAKDGGEHLENDAQGIKN